MRRALALAVMMLFMTGGLAGVGGAGTPSYTNQIAKAPKAAYSNGIEWGDDVALTNNPTEDSHPQLAVSANGTCAVAWERGNLMEWMKLNRAGAVLVAEKTLAVDAFPVQYSGFVSPFIGMDSSGDYHLCAEPIGGGVYYAKFDSFGDDLIPWKSVPSGASSPQLPSLAVSSNDIVNIIYEDSRWGYSQQAITYARLLNDGTVDKDGIRISEASWYCEGSTLCTDSMNRIHATFINTDQGVYHGVLDDFGNPLPQAPDTFLYKTGGFMTNGPPCISCDATGAVWALWNDDPQGRGFLHFMKLDNYGNKLAAGPDGTGILLTAGPTCSGFPSIQADRDGNAFAVWSDIRNGSSQIYGCVISNGNENDTSLTDKAFCIVSDTTGEAVEPNLVMDADQNFHLVWRDNRDGNWEIYYKYGFRAGLDVGMSPEDMYHIMLLEPNETRMANVSVRNTGGMDLDVTLSLDCDSHGNVGWNVSIRPASILLPPFSSRNVTVTVRSPYSGRPGEYIDTRVNASMDGDHGPKGRVWFRTYLNVYYGLLLNCDDVNHTCLAGAETLYQMSVANTGNIPICVSLAADGPLTWKWSLSESLLRLAPNGMAELTLAVDPPGYLGAGDFGVVSVVATIVEDPAFTEKVVTRTTVPLLFSLDIESDLQQAYVDPGGTVSFQLTVTNSGNMPGPAAILLQTSYQGPGWYAFLDKDQLPLAGGDGGLAMLEVLSSAGGRAGSSLCVTVSCFDENRTAEAECNVTAIIRQFHSLVVSVSPGDALTDPGGTVRYGIEVTDRGNGPEKVGVGRFVLPIGFGLSLGLPDGSVLGANETLSLDAGSTASLIATVSIPAGALAGNYMMVGQLLDGPGNSYQVKMECTVNQLYAVELECAAPVQAGEPGDRLLFQLAALNSGNGWDELTFDLSGLPDTWSGPEFFDADMSPVGVLRVAAGESARVTAAVTIPSSTPLDSVDLSAAACSSDGSSAAVNLSVEIRKPDLAIAGITLSTATLRAGGLVLVNVAVENLGDAPASNFTLAYYRNEEPRISRPIGTIPPGGRDTESFVWIPRDGKNKLRFVVDPDNTVCESNESNNEAAMEKFVYTEKVSIPNDQTWMVFAALIPLIGLVLVVLTQKLRRPQRPSTPKSAS